MRKIAEEKGMLKFTFVDMTQIENIEKAINDRTKLLWMETPTNPTLKVCDIEQICKLCKDKIIISVVDNTFPSPYLQSPL